EETPEAPWQLRLRRPAWSAVPHVVCNGATLTPRKEQGYLVIDRAWRPGDVLELDLPMPARLTTAHPRIEATRGSVAVERGPLVYCLEQCDNPSVLDLAIDPSAALATSWQPELLGGVMTIHAAGSLKPSSPG